LLSLFAAHVCLAFAVEHAAFEFDFAFVHMQARGEQSTASKAEQQFCCISGISM
jgi:hypothetical protein